MSQPAPPDRHTHTHTALPPPSSADNGHVASEEVIRGSCRAPSHQRGGMGALWAEPLTKTNEGRTSPQAPHLMGPLRAPLYSGAGLGRVLPRHSGAGGEAWGGWYQGPDSGGGSQVEQQPRSQRQESKSRIFPTPLQPFGAAGVGVGWEDSSRFIRRHLSQSPIFPIKGAPPQGLHVQGLFPKDSWGWKRGL